MTNHSLLDEKWRVTNLWMGEEIVHFLQSIIAMGIGYRDSPTLILPFSFHLTSFKLNHFVDIFNWTKFNLAYKRVLVSCRIFIYYIYVESGVSLNAMLLFVLKHISLKIFKIYYLNCRPYKDILYLSRNSIFSSMSTMCQT